MAWAPGSEADGSGVANTHRVMLHSVHAAETEAAVLDALGVSVSHGLVVAQHAGLPAPVLSRARELLDALNASGVPRAWGKAVRDAVRTK
jgi:hypothetical protein